MATLPANVNSSGCNGAYMFGCSSTVYRSGWSAVGKRTSTTGGAVVGVTAVEGAVVPLDGATVEAGGAAVGGHVTGGLVVASGHAPPEIV